MFLKKYKFDLILIAFFSVFTIFFKFFISNLSDAFFLYFVFIISFKYILFSFGYTKNTILNRINLFSLLVWTLIFAGLSYPYFILEGQLRWLYLNLYFIFMSLLGLNGYTILIFDLNLKDSLLKTYSKMHSQVLSLNFLFGIIVVNYFFFLDLNFDLWLTAPFLLYLVTKKYLKIFR